MLASLKLYVPLGAGIGEKATPFVSGKDEWLLILDDHRVMVNTDIEMRAMRVIDRNWFP
jgi:hypothetical protein